MRGTRHRAENAIVTFHPSSLHHARTSSRPPDARPHGNSPRAGPRVGRVVRDDDDADTLTNGTRLTYGFGLEVVQVSNHAAIMHGGSTPGFTSGSFVFPGDNVDIVLLSNSSVSPSSLALNIVRVLFDIPTSGRGGSRVSVPVAQPLTDADRDRLLGTYDFVPATGSAMVLRVALDEGKLIAQRDGADQRPLPLIHRGNLRFATLVDRAILLTFVEENGKITSLRFQQGAETLVGRRRP